MAFRGAIFDVDGVLVDSPHERAWRDALKELMEGEWSDIRDQTTYSPDRFTPAVYQAVMAGKPVGLANKESMVAAGEILTRAAREKNVPLLPIDSDYAWGVFTQDIGWTDPVAFKLRNEQRCATSAN